jgi:hypothetical protein
MSSNDLVRVFCSVQLDPQFNTRLSALEVKAEFRYKAPNNLKSFSCYSVTSLEYNRITPTMLIQSFTNAKRDSIGLLLALPKSFTAFSAPDDTSVIGRSHWDIRTLPNHPPEKAEAEVFQREIHAAFLPITVILSHTWEDIRQIKHRYIRDSQSSTV